MLCTTLPCGRYTLGCADMGMSEARLVLLTEVRDEGASRLAQKALLVCAAAALCAQAGQQECSACAKVGPSALVQAVTLV
jgi:hypothetical protein